MKPVRLLPLLAVAAVCLFMLKSAGLLLGDGYVLSGSAPAEAQAEPPKAAPEPASQQKSEAGKPAQADAAGNPAEQTANADPAPPQANGEKTGSAAPAEEALAAQSPPTPGAPVGAEKDILVSLAERRKQLEARARELELRENLIKVAENRVESRIKELKEIEKRIDTQLTKRDEEQDAEYEKLVSLYSKMKPKDAARIFEQMEVSVLAGLVRRMNARIVSPILAEMDPVMAKRVTMEMASGNEGPTSALRSLPKINGQNPG